jgi:hypothetical protein
MPIEPSDVPVEAVKAAEGTLDDELGMSALTAFGVPRNANLLSVSLPHRIAVLSVHDIRVGVNPREIAQIGNWRFLLFGRKGSARSRNWAITGAVTVSMNKAKKEYELAELERGLLVTWFEQAVRHAEELDQVRQGKYEVFLLTAPAVYVSTLWLRDQIGKDDLFYLIPYGPAPFVPSNPITTEQFGRRLVEFKRKLRMT